MVLSMTDDLFAVLADPTRRAIVENLAEGERSVGEVVEAVGASQPTVSKHLRVLRGAGLVQQRADGQRRFYSVAPDGFAPVMQWLHRCVPESKAQEPAPSPVSIEPLDPYVVAQDDSSSQRGGLLTGVFRRRRR